MVAMDAEQAMEGRLVAMLEPLAGHDNVRATVNITRDDSTQDRLDEVYDPTQSVTLSSQRTDQIAPGRATAAAGVPGTASNTSAASAPGTVQGAVQSAAAGTTPAANAPALPIYPQGAGGGQSAHEENSQFAVTKHTIHREDVPGRISRITAAVVVNDRASTVGTGDAMHTVWKPRSADEMKRLTELAQAAVGYETTRGDQVVLENIGFQSNQPEPQVKGLAKATEQAQTLLHTQPMLVKDIGLALVGSLLVFFVLRPIVEHTGAALRASASPSAPLALASPIANVAITESPVIADQEELKLKAPKQRMMMNFVTEHIRKEPAQTAQLLQSWIASEEES
jgi:flagellar M-ring protein FliF